MKCRFPECRAKAKKLWALVPLCEDHHEDIQKETKAYYANKSYKKQLIRNDDYRVSYKKISHMIPWSKENLSVGDWK